MCGWTDPDNRRTFPWMNKDDDLILFHRDIIRIHKENPVLKSGSVKFLDGEYKVIAYGRFNRKDKMVVVLNNNEQKVNLELKVDTIGLLNGATLKRLMLTYNDTYTLDPVRYTIEDNHLHLTMPPISAIVLKAE